MANWSLEFTVIPAPSLWILLLHLQHIPVWIQHQQEAVKERTRLLELLLRELPSWQPKETQHGIFVGWLTNALDDRGIVTVKTSLQIVNGRNYKAKMGEADAMVRHRSRVIAGKL